MRMRIRKIITVISLITVSATFISGCSGFFDKDNTPTPTPLANFKQEVSPKLRWYTSIGGGASSNDYLKFNPALSDGRIYTSSSNGYVNAINETNGRILWQARLPTSLSTGPGVDDTTVAVASHNGHIYALDTAKGNIRWQAQMAGNVIAEPAVGHGLVVVKAVNGLTTAYSASTGEIRWQIRQTEPSLLLRGSSAPLIKNQAVAVGYANGNLVKLELNSGDVMWQRPVSVPQGAFSVQRMIDIDANPILFNQQIFVASYQGNIASLNWSTGQMNWAHTLSSYTGMAVESHATYITDASGHVYAFNTSTGRSEWQQNQLEYRVLSAPAIQGNYVVVADQQGYAHWLSEVDGHIAGRVSLGGAVYADPIVNQNTLFILTNKGTLSAYSIN